MTKLVRAAALYGVLAVASTMLAVWVRCGFDIWGMPGWLVLCIPFISSYLRDESRGEPDAWWVLAVHWGMAGIPEATSLLLWCAPGINPAWIWLSTIGLLVRVGLVTWCFTLMDDPPDLLSTAERGEPWPELPG
jgi:hypothetical protein